MSDKIIVTNKSQLTNKYGTSTTAIDRAIRNMIAADRRRGITTKIVNLDVAAEMRAYGGNAVTRARNASQNKAAIYAICKNIHPDYLMILGATDIVPHAPLRNTMPGDGDSHAYGDISLRQHDKL